MRARLLTLAIASLLALPATAQEPPPAAATNGPGRDGAPQAPEIPETAKTPETRAARIGKLVAMLARGEKIHG